MLYIEEKIDMNCLRRWVRKWDRGMLAKRLHEMVEPCSDTTLSGDVLSGYIAKIQEFVDLSTNAAVCLHNMRSMLSRGIYDSYFRADNGLMNVGNLYELLLLPTDVATKKKLIKGFDYSESGLVKITHDGEIVGEIGVKSDLFWHTFYENYILEDEKTGSVEHVRDNHDHEFTLQVWKPGLVTNVAEFEHLADTVIFECAEQLGLAFRRERFCHLTASEGSAEVFNVVLTGHAYEKAPVLHYASALSSAIPAHQFLAWYHVLEFYFSRARARLIQQRRVSEREMLNFVLANLVDWSGFLSWAREDSKRMRVFTTAKMPPFTVIDLSSESNAIESTTERVYLVRCEIVHSKEGVSSASPIAPGIADIMVEPELELVKYLAGQVITNGNRL
jgi:hypothetical protein